MKNPSIRALNYPQRVASERLELRWPLEADARELFERCTSDPVVTRYLLWQAHTSIDQTLAFISTPVTDNGVEFQSWLMRTKAQGQIVGVIGCRCIEPHILQFGYYLAQAEWGRGYATEATRAMVPLWLSHPEIFRVQALCDLENAPSARVLTKAGLSLEGTLGRYIFSPNLGPEPRDGHLFAATKGDAAINAATPPA